MEKYTIVGIAIPEVQNILQKIKTNFNISNDIVDDVSHYILKDMAHLAIKRTFYLNQGIQEKDIIESLKKINFKKITIKSSEVGVFSGSSYGEILFAKVEDNDELQKLHTEIKNIIDNITQTKNPEMEGNNHLPHISLIYGISPDIIDEVKLYAQKFFPFEFTLKEIVLLRDFDTSKDERIVVYTHLLN